MYRVGEVPLRGYITRAILQNMASSPENSVISASDGSAGKI